MTPIDGGEIVAFCVAIADVTIEVVMTVVVVRLRVVVANNGGDFIMPVLTSVVLGSIAALIG